MIHLKYIRENKFNKLHKEINVSKITLKGSVTTVDLGIIILKENLKLQNNFLHIIYFVSNI